MNFSDIASKIPSDVMDQKILKTKVLFLDVNKNDKHYSPRKDFSVNGRRYMVVDGKEAYLPMEAYSALKQAVMKKKVAVSKRQERDGIDLNDPSDKYKVIDIPRFDLTVIDEYQLVVEDGVNKLISKNETVSEKAALETANLLAIEKEKQIRQELEEEFEEKMRARLEEKDREIAALASKIPAPISESEIDDLVEGDI